MLSEIFRGYLQMRRESTFFRLKHTNVATKRTHPFSNALSMCGAVNIAKHNMNKQEIDYSHVDAIYSKDLETKGFELSSGVKWIYPENYPLRDYQFKIVQSALYKNTLVCLPTGLGKTFIAAVVMYNFWRWYPQGKVVFMAPTRPLVSQQILACHDIMGISSTETVELTGTVNHKNRQEAWAKKRIIFATPQVFHKDLDKGIVPFDLIKCVVVDEAHRALGKHSYCESIHILSEHNKYFRILALSATPGNKIDKVIEVIQNLRISHLELRDDSSPDILPYINERKTDVMIIPLDNKLLKFRDSYIRIMDPHFRILLKYKIIKSVNVQDITKGKIFKLMEFFQQSQVRGANHKTLMITFNVLLTMSHAYEVMIRNGLRAFYNFYQNHLDKFWMNNEPKLQELLEELKSYLGEFPIIQPLPNGSIPEVPANIVFGHPKLKTVKELLLNHFKQYEEEGNDTRAIVFVEYKDSANEVYVLLLQLKPLIRPQIFVGQSGQRQRQQLKALEDFKSNQVNVLVSTSVGEEGLDVGEVDLIICFDASQNSPSRLVQRMGRTGRKRNGRIVLLVTDGKEYQTLKSMMNKKDTLNQQILHSNDIASAMYQESPRMVPVQFTPQCYKMSFIVQPKTPQLAKKRKKAPVEKKKSEAKSRTKSKKKEVQTTSKTNNNQFSMQQFLNRLPRESSEDNESISSFVSQTPTNCDIIDISNSIKALNIKLLTDDRMGEEFLTLCAMKDSEIQKETDEKRNIIYLPHHHSPLDMNVLSNYTVPDIQILDYISLINEDNIQHSCYQAVDVNEISMDNDDFDCNVSPYNNFDQDSKIVENVNNMRFSIDNGSNNIKSCCEVKEDYHVNLSENNVANVKNTSHNFESDEFDEKLKDVSIFCDLLKDSDDNVEEHDKDVTKNKSMPSIFDHLLDDTSEENEEENEEVLNNMKDDNNTNVNTSMINNSLINTTNNIQMNNSTEKVFNSNVNKSLSKNITDNIQVTKELSKPCIQKESKSASVPESAAKSHAIVIPDSDEDMFMDDIDNFACEEDFDKTQLNLSTKIEDTQIKPECEQVDDDMFVIEEFDKTSSDISKSMLQDETTSLKNIKTLQVNTYSDKSGIDCQIPEDIGNEFFDETFINSSKTTVQDKIVLEKIDNNAQDNKHSEESDTDFNVPQDISSDFFNDCDDNVFCTKETSENANVKAKPEVMEEEVEKSSINTRNVQKTKYSIFNMDVESLKKASIICEVNRSNNITNTFADSQKETLQIPKLLSLHKLSSTSNNSSNTSNNVSKKQNDKNNKVISKNCKNTTLDKFVFVDKKNNSITEKQSNDDNWESDFDESTMSKYFQSTDFSPAKLKVANQQNSNNCNLDWISVKKSQSQTMKQAQPSSSVQIEPNVNRNVPVKTLSLKMTKRNNLTSNTEKQSNAQSYIENIHLSAEEHCSDDDFVKPMFLPVKGNNERRALSENNFGISVKSEKKPSTDTKITCNTPSISSKLASKEKERPKRRRLKPRNEYIDDEANVSIDVVTTDGSSGTSDTDNDLEGFVSNTQIFDESHMHAHYLQSVRSPNVRGNFVFKQNRNHIPKEMVYSQPLTQLNDTYMNDTFCVPEGTESNESDSSRSSLLDTMEAVLEQEKRKRKMKNSSREYCSKRRKTEKRVSESSSEDEVEKLRQQIHEESMLLKNDS